MVLYLNIMLIVECIKKYDLLNSVFVYGFGGEFLCVFF